jgi:uncharacterized repeat protein (TIGR03837 family)
MARVWDLFCRVVDNFGDIGVCWRVAIDLADRGEAVRLWTDDASALAWMAPEGRRGVQVLPWSTAEAQPPGCGDVVIEAFACELPETFVRTMAQRAVAPVWINLEYLTAQPFAARNHGLASPQLSGPGAGLVKWFFHPGFGPGTGGLIRESNLSARQRSFDSQAWRAARGLAALPEERSVSLFCYAGAALPELLDALSGQPTVLLAAPGAATESLRQSLGRELRRGALRGIALPWLSQIDFDHLLWSCDLNVVRGEDSWVRAQCCDRPFVWQPYVQSDAAHHAKLHAFLDLYLAGAAPELARGVRALWAAWNRLPQAAGAAGPARIELPDMDLWQAHQRRWCDAIGAQVDLTTRLLGFVNGRG